MAYRPLRIPVTEEGARTIHRASLLASRREGRTVRLGDLFASLLTLHHNDARRITIELGVTPKPIECLLGSRKTGLRPGADVSFSDRSKQALDRACSAALEDGRKNIPTSYLLWALLDVDPKLTDLVESRAIRPHLSGS